jgi:uncharacterized membrane protein
VQDVADPHKPFRFATVDDDLTQWRLKRNCSLTPQQACWFFLLLCALSMSVGLFFWLQGATLVLAFTALELAAVAIAFLLYARHAADGECIRLERERLVIELETAGQLQRTEFARDWVRIAPPARHGSLIELCAGGRSVQVGRFLRAELRPALAREIRQALRTT